MEKMLNPLQIFQNTEILNEASKKLKKDLQVNISKDEAKNLQTTFLPVQFKNPQILFWRVPELLEKNENNLPAYEVTPGEGANELSFFQARSAMMETYIDKNVIAKIHQAYDDDESPVSNARMFCHYTNLIRLLENSDAGRVGSHLAGLYFDCSKLESLLNLPFEERERIVDNNLVLANVACIYGAYAENHDVASCEKTKKVFNTTLELLAHKDVHLKPICCIVQFNEKTVKNSKGELFTEIEYSPDKRSYKVDGPDLKINELKEKNLTLQADLVDQYDQIAKKQKKKLDVDFMYYMQDNVIKKEKERIHLKTKEAEL